MHAAALNKDSTCPLPKWFHIVCLLISSCTQGSHQTYLQCPAIWLSQFCICWRVTWNRGWESRGNGSQWRLRSPTKRYKVLPIFRECNLQKEKTVNFSSSFCPFKWDKNHSTVEISSVSSKPSTKLYTDIGSFHTPQRQLRSILVSKQHGGLWLLKRHFQSRKGRTRIRTLPSTFPMSSHLVHWPPGQFLIKPRCP